MRLYLVRHAKAEQGEPDDLRRLTPDGRAAARDLGRRLAAEGVAPDAVLSSPLLRARETAEEIVEEVTITVVHEIAHHFGIDEERLHQLGWG